MCYPRSVNMFRCPLIVFILLRLRVRNLFLDMVIFLLWDQFPDFNLNSFIFLLLIHFFSFSPLKRVVNKSNWKTSFFIPIVFLSGLSIWMGFYCFRRFLNSRSRHGTKRSFFLLFECYFWTFFMELSPFFFQKTSALALLSIRKNITGWLHHIFIKCMKKKKNRSISRFHWFFEAFKRIVVFLQK